MTWQKVARVVVAAIGLATAGAVYLLTRERPAVSPPPSGTEAADPAAKMQSGPGRQVRYDGNRPIGELTFADFRTYEDNRVVWLKFEYKLHDGTVLSADRVEATGTESGSGKPDDLALKGRVNLRTADGTTLTGDSGTYNEATGVAKVPGPTSFSRGRMSGTGTGGEYSREAGVFRLFEDVEVTMAPGEAGGTPLEATAESMTFTTGVKSVLFEGGARLARSAETMEAERATLFFSEDEQRFRLIELRGKAEVTPEGGQSTGLPEMHADDIDLTFYENSDALEGARLSGRATMVQATAEGRRSIEAAEIDFGTARDGTTLTRLRAAPRGRGERIVVRMPGTKEAPSRTITSATLVANGDEKVGLTAALFDGGAEFVEVANRSDAASGSRRVGKAQRLTLVLRGQLDAIDEARFDRDVTFTSGTVEGFGDIGVYRAKAGELDLQPGGQAPRRRARVSDGDTGVTVEAAGMITVHLDTGNLHARDNVDTVTAGRAKGSASSTSIFNDADPIYGSGAEFLYDDASMRATYRGAAGAPAQLRQIDNIIRGLEIVYLREQQDLGATGAVDSTFDLTVSPRAGRAATGAVRYRMTADALAYTEKARTATYTGAARLRGPDGDMTAATIALILSRETRSLDRLEATGRVHAVLEGGREARGDRLVYEARDDRYLLWGKPLTWISKENDGTCYAQDGNFVRFDGDLGAPDFPADQNADGGAPRRSIPCPVTLTK
jgi:lipopolysaccharide export system protein LptA